MVGHADRVARVGTVDTPVIASERVPGGGAVSWCFTGRSQGDLSEAAPDAVALLGSNLGVPIHTVHQIHSADVQVLGPDDVEPTGRPVSSFEADGLVTALPGVGLGVRTADCAPVLMWSPEGIVGAAHGGWTGLLAGIIEAVAASMRTLGATDVRAVLGPCIGPECYEFGAADLDRMAAHFGNDVRATASDGSVALDLRAAVAAACARADVTLSLHTSAATQGEAVPPCTGCGGAHFSHRARAERARQLAVIWSEL